MKLKFFIASALMFTASVYSEAQQRITKFYVSKPKEVKMPLMADSINNQGSKFSIDNLQRTEVDLFDDKKNFTLMETDTAGVLKLHKLENKYAFYIVKTRVRADKYSSGNINVVSPNRWEAFMNGYSMQLKNTAEDSISASSHRDIAFSTEPEQTYDLVFKIFVTPEDKMAPYIKAEIKKSNEEDNVQFTVDADAKKRLTIHNTIYNNRASSVSLSPSGKYLMTKFWYNFGDRKSRTFSQISNVKTGKIIVKNGRDGMNWMPNSDKLYYTVTGEVGRDIMTFDPESLDEEILATNIPEGYFRWSPTEEYILYFPEESEPRDMGDVFRISSPQARVPGSEMRSFIEKYNLKDKTKERVTFGKSSTSLNSISADGTKILYSTHKENITKRPFTRGALYQLDLTTMKVDTLIKETLYHFSANYSPDSKHILLTSAPDAFNGIGKNSGKHKIANDFDTQAFIMNVETKEIEPITKNFDPTVEFVTWHKADNHIYFETTDKEYKNIYKYDVKNKKFVKLHLEVDAIRDFTIARNNANYVAYTGESDSYSGGAYLLDNKKNMTLRTIADPMKPIYEDLELGEVKPWTFTASDGTVIDGRVCLPPNFDPQKKYPMIVYYYGGTMPTTKGINSPYSAQLFASQNYVVYMIQPSGTIGYGQEFSARHVNAWGKRTAEDIIEGTKQVCKEHPFIDDKKIGCIGASYGGFMTQYLQTQTDIFAAAVSHAGISNVASYWGEGYWGYSYNGVAAADSYPWNNPELFTKQGSLFNADKINTPLLLLHGLSDTNVPVGESIQLFNALKILGKTVEFIGVKGEDHFISDPQKRIKWHQATMAWFAKYLKDSPEWWESMYPTRN